MNGEMKHISKIHDKILEIRKSPTKPPRPVFFGIILDSLIFLAAIALVAYEWWGYNFMHYGFWSDSYHYPWWHWNGGLVKIYVTVVFVVLTILYHLILFGRRRFLQKKRKYLISGFEKGIEILRNENGIEAIYTELDKLIMETSKIKSYFLLPPGNKKLQLDATIKALSWIVSE